MGPARPANPPTDAETADQLPERMWQIARVVDGLPPFDGDPDLEASGRQLYDALGSALGIPS